jgi:fumarate hydratase subunit alpha
LEADKLEEVAFRLLKKASTILPRDVKEALKKAYESESSQLGKTQLEAILDNITAAQQLGKPICQDTGMVAFFIKARSIDYAEAEEALRKATIRATKNVPLRPNAVHPITRKNTGNNTGTHIPAITWLYENVDYMEVTTVLKGTGSENMSSLHILPPGEGIKGIKRIILETVIKAGGQPCPPTVINIGLGGTLDLTFKLAKLALIRPIGVRHPEEAIASLEKEILQLVNATGVGPMGLGGKTTALDVKIEYAHCHTGSLPVGINFQCWADRRAVARIYSNGLVEMLD